MSYPVCILHISFVPSAALGIGAIFGSLFCACLSEEKETHSAKDWLGGHKSFHIVCFAEWQQTFFSKYVITKLGVHLICG